MTAYERPHRFAYEERDWNPEKQVPPWVTEILVEAKQGGTCVVRLVSGVFADGDWSDEIAGSGDGWGLALHNLSVHFEQFAGQPCASLFALATVDESGAEAWAALCDALSIGDVAEGDRVKLVDVGPRLSGVVERLRPELVVLRSEEPAPGVVALTAVTHAGTHLFVRGYLYGDDRDAVAEREEAAWKDWLSVRFPSARVAVGA